MASGGGGHPSHLPIIPPITSQHQTFTASGSSGNNSVGTGGRVRGSLQTPDASSLFVSSLGGPGMGGSGNNNNTNAANFAPSPIDHSQSFNSLEELLNVTGINSLERNGAKRLREQDGVDSLQRMAKEVESRESGVGGGMLEPPNKRMHLDSPLNAAVNATTTSPGLGSYTSIHSSSTTTLPSLPAFSSSLPQSTFTNSIHSTTPIASLLDKRDFPGSSTSGSIQEPKASNSRNMFPQSSSVFLPPISSHLPSLPPPPPYSFNNTSSVGVAPQNAPLAIGGTSVSNGNSSTHFSSLVDLTVGNSGGMKPSTNLPQPTNFAQPANLSQPANPSRLQQQQSATVPPQQPVSGNQGSNTTSKLADSINTNSRSVVIQLMQLYKQYQSLNDQQGMKRVRDQLNMLVSAQQKILAAQNVMVKTTTEKTTAETASGTAGSVTGGSASAQAVSGGRMGGMSGSSAQQPQQQQQQVHQILGQLAGIAKGGQSRTGTGGGTQMWQGSGGGGGGNVSSSSAPATNHVRSSGTATDWESGSFAEKGGGALSSLPPPPAYSDASIPSSSVVNTPPSLLSHIGSGTSAGNASNAAGLDSQTGTQKAVKQIRMLMDALPDSKRPKNVQELKEFVLQKYSSLVNKGAGNGGNPTSTASSAGSFLPKTSVLPSLSDSSGSRGQLQQGMGSVSQSPSANVAEHFRNSLIGSSANSSASLSSVSRLGGTEIPSSLPPSSRLPLPTFPPSSSSAVTVGSVLPDSMKSLSSSQQQQQLPGSGTMHAPVTSQFGKSPVPSTLQSSNRQNPMAPPPPALPPFSVASSSSSTGIQAGIPTPLPPGLTLETLGVLCRLPENELQKLKLPPALLSAIKVWKARQVPGTKAKVPTAAAKAGNIPVLIPPPSDQSSSLNSSSSSTGQHSMIPSHSSSIVAFNNKPSASPSLPPPPPHPHHLVVTPKNHSLGIGQPNVIPSGAGFPPRSLHAYIPGSSTSLGLQTTPRYQSSGTSTSASQHLTRYKLKVEQQKVKNERFQALQKALETSEEARIAFRFSAHLEKMHSQLLNPDTVNAFRSHNDILARLLPYHLYAEPEPPPAAVEKADAVFESVAQVLLSRSRGLKSRFEQTIMKSNTEGGAEHRDMQMQLERLFIEGEQERIQKEKQEKKEAEQIAADLSLMVDHVGTFDSEFSFGDVFNPLMSVDSGIT